MVEKRLTVTDAFNLSGLKPEEVRQIQDTDSRLALLTQAVTTLALREHQEDIDNITTPGEAD